MVSISRQSNNEHGFVALRQSFARGAGLDLHAHREGQLIFAVSGTMQVKLDAGRWLVPPHLAVWAPCKLPHAVDMLSPVEMLTVYYDEALARPFARGTPLNRAFALHVTPLLKQLILALFRTDTASEKARMIGQLTLTELSHSTDAPTYLPLPTSIIGKRVADLALSTLCHSLSISEFADKAATSTRTISRIFPQETGLTFKSWLQRAKIVTAIDQLVAGVSVTDTALNFGFSSTSAFTFAFRTVTGASPSAFLRKIDSHSI